MNDASRKAFVLIERLKNASDSDDRVDALECLSKLSVDHPAEVADYGIQVLADLVQSGMLESDVGQLIMDIMLNLVVVHDQKNASSIESNVSVMLRSGGSIIHGLLDLTHSSDTLTSINALRIVSAVQKTAPINFNDFIVSNPTSIQRMVDALLSRRDSLQSEAVLLLRDITFTEHPEIIRMIAFQEGFERIFGIMSKEGMINGSVLVLDCLEICSNMLRGSSLACALFCQSQCLKVFHQLIDVRWLARTDESMEENELQQNFISSLQERIMTEAFNILISILRPDGKSANDKDVSLVNPNGNETFQGALGKAANGLLLELIAHIALSKAYPYCDTPENVRLKSLETLHCIVNLHAENQKFAVELLIQDVGTASILLPNSLIEAALLSKESHAGTTKYYRGVFEACYRGNPLICAQFFSYIVSPPPIDVEIDLVDEWAAPTQPGQMLLDIMVRSGFPAECKNSEIMDECLHLLSMLLIEGKTMAKEIALHVSICPIISSQTDNIVMSLMECITFWIEESLASKSTTPNEEEPFEMASYATVIALLEHMCIWLYDCSSVVNEFLRSSSFLVILKLASTRIPVDFRPKSPKVVQLLASLILGMSVKYLGENREWTQFKLMAVIESRNGLTQLMNCLSDIFSYYDKICRKRDRVDVYSTGDSRFLHMVRECVPLIRRCIITLYTLGDSSFDQDEKRGDHIVPDDMKRWMDLIELQESEISKLQLQLRQTEDRIPLSPNANIQPVASTSKVEINITKKAEYANVLEVKDLEKRLSESESEIRGLSLALDSQERMLFQKDAEISNLKKLVASLEDHDISALENYLENELLQSKQTISKVQQEMDSLRRALSESNAVIEKAENETEILKNRVAQFETDLESAENVAQSYSALEHRALHAEKWVSELETSLVQQCEELERLRTLTSKTNHDDLISSIEKEWSLKLGKAESLLEESKNENSRLQKYRENFIILEKSNADLLATVAKLESEMTVLNTRVKGIPMLEGICQDLRTQNKSLSQEICTLKEGIDLSQVENQVAEDLIRQLKSVIANRDEELLQVHQESEDKISALKETIDTILNSAADNDNSRVCLEALASLRDEHEDLLSMVAQVEMVRGHFANVLKEHLGTTLFLKAFSEAKAMVESKFGIYVDFDTNLEHNTISSDNENKY